MNENNMFGGWVGVIALIVILLFGGNLFGNGSANVEAAVNAAVNNQTTQNGIRDVLLSSANNNLETLQAINGQTMAIMQQNNTNLINAIQGFNQINLTNANQFAELRQQIGALSSQMETCCSAIKTQMLQDKYDGLLQQYNALLNETSNDKQSQYLLGVMGKWQANPAATAA